MQSDSFNANFDPRQPRDNSGRWIFRDESITMAELESMANFIRDNDSTFPSAAQLLIEMGGDSQINREELLNHLSQVQGYFFSQKQIDNPEAWAYVLDEEMNDMFYMKI